MPRGSVDMNFLFALGELNRLVRAYADKQAARHGITRAQWAVLAKVERTEGLKQSELAELMEMQPITLTRLIDKLCDNGLDRAAQRRHRPARQPALSAQGGAAAARQTRGPAFRTHRDRARGHQPADAHRLLSQLETIKENVRNAIRIRRTCRPTKRAAIWLIPS